MHPDAIQQAADQLRQAATSHQRLEELPQTCRPLTFAEGYAIQARVAGQSGRRLAGWKIAAIGIGTDGPFAGRLLSGHVVASGLGFPLSGNRIQMAEAEFAFCMARDLPARPTPYSVDEVVAAIATLHPAIEIPDSRYHDFRRVTSAELIADAAYSAWLATGVAAPDGWRNLDLRTHAVQVWRNGTVVPGVRENVLGSPYLALTWLANALPGYGEHLRAGDMITTGGCMPLLKVEPGDCMRADFGALGHVEAAFY